MWRNLLGMTVTSYGVGGAGFSSVQGTSIQQQVVNCANSGIEYDVFVLWASTNDYTNSRPIGEYTDYSVDDNYDTDKLISQCGGINYAIKYLSELNPKAELYVFTGMRFFSSRAGYDPFTTIVNNTGNNFSAYVDAQKKCCERYGIPVLDQFNFQGCNEYNYTRYYQTDKLHLTEEGYRKIAPVQVAFLANGY
jgi:lysophospholipase L1-like esterase